MRQRLRTCVFILSSPMLLEAFQGETASILGASKAASSTARRMASQESRRDPGHSEETEMTETTHLLCILILF